MTKKKKPKVIRKKKCYCGKTFDVWENNPQKRYCSGECWCKANKIDEEKRRHYLGGHKQIKRQKKK